METLLEVAKRRFRLSGYNYKWCNSAEQLPNGQVCFHVPGEATFCYNPQTRQIIETRS